MTDSLFLLGILGTIIIIVAIVLLADLFKGTKL